MEASVSSDERLRRRRMNERAAEAYARVATNHDKEALTYSLLEEPERAEHHRLAAKRCWMLAERHRKLAEQWAPERDQQKTKEPSSLVANGKGRRTRSPKSGGALGAR